MFHALLKCNGIDFHRSDPAASQHREGTVPALRGACTLRVPSEELRGATSLCSQLVVLPLLTVRQPPTKIRGIRKT